MDTYKVDPSVKQQFKSVFKYKYDFENLAFEGGGAKMIAYAGVAKVLEELGILQKCKRFAGTSGGAIAAALLATGHTPDEMRKLMDLPMESLLLDSWWGKWSFPLNMFRTFGWNAGKTFLDKLRDIMKEKTGEPDITFLQVYKKYGKELCVVATNVTTSSVEYFHPKTTPNMSVALAVRCSVSLPVLLKPVEVILESGMKQLYVDGGVVVNYPLHVFDGWYLSMKKEDSFFKRLANSDLPFGEPEDFNTKTLGVLVYTFWEDEIMKADFCKRKPLNDLKRPGTTLAKARQAQSDKLIKEYETKISMVNSAKLFLRVLDEMDEDDDCEIDSSEFRNAIARKCYPEAYEDLFDDDFDLEDACRRIESGAGKMRLNDFIMILQRKGIRWTQLLEGGHQVNPQSVKDFYTGLLNTTMGMSRKAYYRPVDCHRSAGVFTDYIYTADFTLEQEDIDFLVRVRVAIPLLHPEAVQPTVIGIRHAPVLQLVPEQGEIGIIQYLKHIAECCEKEEIHNMDDVVSPKQKGVDK